VDLVEHMATRIHTTVMGHRIEFDPPPKVARFLERIERMVDDPDVTQRDMIGLVYSQENPILDHTIFPERGGVTRDVLADPVYAVMTDLIFRKHIAEDRIDVAKLAAKYSMTVAEAAEHLGINESAVRQGIASKRIPSFVKDGRHFIDPRSLTTLEVGTRGPRGRARELGGPLEIVMGHTKGASLKVKCNEPIEPMGRLDGNVLRGRLRRWKRVVVMTTGEGGTKRAFVLDRGDADNAIEHGPFSVRGRFVIKEKANSSKSAEQVWAVYEVE